MTEKEKLPEREQDEMIEVRLGRLHAWCMYVSWIISLAAMVISCIVLLWKQ